MKTITANQIKTGVIIQHITADTKYISVEDLEAFIHGHILGIDNEVLERLEEALKNEY